jgi:homoserine O-acetyltransferase/O-succinyltransferase
VDADTGARGWWEQLVGPGRPVDTDDRFVVCANLLGGCRGTTGPLSTDPATGRAYGSRFPHLAIRDLVAVHRALVAHLGLGPRVDLVGGSLGGMQALQWALDFPEEVGRVVLVCATSRLSAENLAFSDVAREAILTDPDFQGGDYPGTGRRPDRGMAIARRLGHITYVSPEALERKFGRARRDPARPVDFHADFEVEHYLDHQAEVFLARFDALTYLHLLRPMDHFDPFADGGLDLARVAAAGVRVLCVSFDSDWRFGPQHSARIASELGAGGVDVVHHVVASPHGHDSFLLDVPEYHGHVRDLLA